jgi:hypothetical protein
MKLFYLLKIKKIQFLNCIINFIIIYIQFNKMNENFFEKFYLSYELIS